MQCFEVEQPRDGVICVMARRPPVNAMSPDLLVELEQVVTSLAAREDVRCVVFGSRIPDYFMVGFDLHFLGERIERGLKDRDLEELRSVARQVHRTMDAIEALPQPTIAALSGHAVGGGAELALACDVRIMADDPKYRIGLPEVLFGVVPAAGGTQRLVRVLGLAQATPFLLEGRRVPPAEALRIGLVHELAPRDGLDEAVRLSCERMLKGGRLAQSMVKRCLRAGLSDGQAGYMMEDIAFAACAGSQEAAERVVAFLAGHARGA
jgi:enoyl-CoA hydratase